MNSGTRNLDRMGSWNHVTHMHLSHWSLRFVYQLQTLIYLHRTQFTKHCKLIVRREILCYFAKTVPTKFNQYDQYDQT